MSSSLVHVRAPIRSVAKTVDLTADWLSSHSSKCIKVRPIVLHHAWTAWVCHMVASIGIRTGRAQLGVLWVFQEAPKSPGPLYLILEM